MCEQGCSGCWGPRVSDVRTRLLSGNDGVLYAVVHAPLHFLAHVARRAEALYLARKARGVALRVPALYRGYAAPPLRTAACSRASIGSASHSLDLALHAAWILTPLVLYGMRKRRAWQSMGKP